MKISENRLFPHPVLRAGSGNFISSEFKVEVNSRHNEIEFEFEFEVTLDEENLINLLKKGEVRILCHLECTKTKFRSIKELKIGKNNFNINAKEIDGRLELVALIIAERDMESYNSKDFDSDYGNNSFSIKKNEILAIADIPSVFVENKKENLSNLPSIFDISYDPDVKVMKLILNEDRIKIILPLDEFKIRNAHKNSLHSRNIMNAMIVFPALIATLNDLSHKNSEEMFVDLRWFSVINKKLKKLGYNIEEGALEDDRVFSIAQELLGELFLDAMDSLQYLEESKE
jgi:hypothetical protein